MMSPYTDAPAVSPTSRGLTVGGIDTGNGAEKLLRALKTANAIHVRQLELLRADLLRQLNGLQPIYLVDFDLLHKLMHPLDSPGEDSLLLTRWWLLRSSQEFAIPIGTWFELIMHLEQRTLTPADRTWHDLNHSRTIGTSIVPSPSSTETGAITKMRERLQELTLDLARYEWAQDLLYFISRPNVKSLDEIVSFDNLLGSIESGLPRGRHNDDLYWDIANSLYAQRSRTVRRRAPGPQDGADAWNILSVLGANRFFHTHHEIIPTYYFALATSTNAIVSASDAYRFDDWVTEELEIQHREFVRSPAFYAYYSCLVQREEGSSEQGVNAGLTRTNAVMSAIGRVDDFLRNIKTLNMTRSRRRGNARQVGMEVFDMRMALREKAGGFSRLPDELERLESDMTNVYLSDIEGMLTQDWIFAVDLADWWRSTRSEDKWKDLTARLGRRPWQEPFRDTIVATLDLLLEEASNRIDQFEQAIGKRGRRSRFGLQRSVEEALKLQFPDSDGRWGRVWSICRSGQAARVAAKWEEGQFDVIWPTLRIPRDAVGAVATEFFASTEHVSVEASYMDDAGSVAAASWRVSVDELSASLAEGQRGLLVAVRVQQEDRVLGVTAPTLDGAAARCFAGCRGHGCIEKIVMAFERTRAAYLPSFVVTRWLRQVGSGEVGLRAESGRV